VEKATGDWDRGVGSAGQRAEHLPVLYSEALDWLDPRPGGRYVDCTVGLGGHSAGILERSEPDGQLLGIDADTSALELARERLVEFGTRVTLVHDTFDQLDRLARSHAFTPADGVLFDLGVSSLELDRPERGFSLRSEAPLDMRFDQSGGRTAADILAATGEKELADLLYRYGEEPRSRGIARAIVAARARQPIETTAELARLVERVYGRASGRVHPATRTFQALRIAVNDELEMLESALPQALSVLAPGGRLVVISFHSLEDRLVKRFLVDQARGCRCPPEVPICVCGGVPAVEILTRKVVTPTPEEAQRNHRARSAKLRAARKLDTAR